MSLLAFLSVVFQKSYERDESMSPIHASRLISFHLHHRFRALPAPFLYPSPQIFHPTRRVAANVATRAQCPTLVRHWWQQTQIMVGATRRDRGIHSHIRYVFSLIPSHPYHPISHEGERPAWQTTPQTTNSVEREHECNWTRQRGQAGWRRRVRAGNREGGERLLKLVCTQGEVGSDRWPRPAHTLSQARSQDEDGEIPPPSSFPLSVP